MKSIIQIITCCCIFIIQAKGQVVFTSLPQTLQAVPRNIHTNKGTVVISGKVGLSSSYTQMKVYKYRENVFQQTYIQSLSYVGDSAAFSFSIPIVAELANYKVDIYGVTSGNAEIFVTTADSLGAADGYIVNGQSNAVAAQYAKSSNTENRNSFIRVWGSGTQGSCTKKWFIADGDTNENGDGNAGQWALRLGKLLLDF